MFNFTNSGSPFGNMAHKGEAFGQMNQRPRLHGWDTQEAADIFGGRSKRDVFNQMRGNPFALLGMVGHGSPMQGQGGNGWPFLGNPMSSMMGNPGMFNGPIWGGQR